jgi:uncharacterized protein YbjQ (UPF0145 family)
VSDWVGGLPPSAHDRIARQRASGTAGSLLSASATAAIRSAGLAPIGEVFGCLVMNLGWSNNGCGWYGGGMPGTGFGQMGGQQWGGQTMWGAISPVYSTAGRSSYVGFAPYVKAFEAGWYGALDRLLTEARALGADGVVDVRVTRSHLTGQAWEFAALGTAVRSIDTTKVAHAKQPADVWTADLSAEDCASAILSGRVPAGMVFGMVVTTKHEDYQLRQQRMSWAGQEIDGLTELLQTARHDARRLVTARAGKSGGELVIKGMSVREFDSPCGQNESDVHAEAAIEGTVLRPGPILPLRARDVPSTSRVIPILSLADLGQR